MYFQKNQGVLKQPMSIELGEEEAGATDQSGWQNSMKNERNSLQVPQW